MAKKVYVGISGKARQVKKIYLGVEDIARKVKKAYIGVGGVARQFWGGGELVYYGYAPALSSATEGVQAVGTGDYAIFASGNGKKVDCYNANLVKKSATDLAKAKSYGGFTMAGDYAVLGAGWAGDCTVYAYDRSLTQSRPTDMTGGADRLGFASLGGYAIFAGGGYSSTPPKANVNAYDSSLVKSNPTNLDYRRFDLKGASVGNYVIFAGGMSDGSDDYARYSYADAYDSNLTKIRSVTALSAVRLWMGAVSFAGKALFTAGGNTGADVYNENLVRTTIGCTVNSAVNHGTTIEGYAVFSTMGTASYAYDENLVQLTTPDFQVYKQFCGAASIGNYALFGGGNGGQATEVEVFTVV